MIVFANNREYYVLILLTEYIDMIIIYRAGEMTQEEIEKVKAIIQNPRQYNIPDWFLNRRKDMQTGKPLHLHAHQLAAKFREDLQKWKKTRYILNFIFINYHQYQLSINDD